MSLKYVDSQLGEIDDDLSSGCMDTEAFLFGQILFLVCYEVVARALVVPSYTPDLMGVVTTSCRVYSHILWHCSRK